MLTLSNICRLPSKLRRRARRRRMATLLFLLFLLWLAIFLPLYAIYKPPAFLLAYLSRRWPDVLFQVDGLQATAGAGAGAGAAGGRKLVALTIDDFPSERTREILALLHEHGARATFFVIGGQAEGDGGREALLREAVRQGHELGNHGQHDEAARSLPGEELEAQILHVQSLIRDAYAEASAGEASGPKHNYFRPGSGFFSDRMRRLVSRLGFRLVLGSIYPHDAQISSWRANAAHILSMLAPGRIIICHDRRSWTVPMLRAVLPEVKRRGYELVTVTELLEAAGT